MSERLNVWLQGIKGKTVKGENNYNHWRRYSKILCDRVMKNIKDLNLDADLEVSRRELEIANYRLTGLSTGYYSDPDAWKVLCDKLEDLLHYIVSLE